jgi:hypothetical protein
MEAVMDGEGPTLPITPVERAFAAEYGLDETTWISAWENAGIDWIFSREDIDASLHQWDQFVFVDNKTGLDTWLGGEPFSALLEKMDGKVLVEDGEVVVLCMNCACRAPDASTAETLYAELDAYFKATLPFEPFGTIDTMLSEDEVDRLQAGRIPVEGFPVMDAGSIERDGLKLSLKGVHVEFNVDVWEAVSQLSEAFRSRGCTDIQLTFVELINTSWS